MTAIIKDRIAALVGAALEAAQRAGDLPAVALPEVTIDRPKIAEHGDYASNVAMRLQRATGGKPLDIAATVVKHLPADPAIGEAGVAPPGFINFRLDEDWLREQVATIVKDGARFGDRGASPRLKVQVEFVSANPTGPAHVGNGRGAALGSTLANVLRAAGHEVETEYYVNDAGTQAEVFAATLYVRYQQLFDRRVEVPEGGYPGAYMIELAEALKSAYGDRFLRPEGEPADDELGRLGLEMMVEQIRRDLALLNVGYDVWFRERSLYEGEGSPYDVAMEILRDRGYVAEREGATWFTSSELGEDKDNVLVRSGGAPTYFASDIAYHRDKFVTRRFDKVIDIWGADHQGHVSRLKAAVDAIGADPVNLRIILYQLVTLKRGGELVRLSKRAGDIITLREVVEEVGPDACRYFFLLRSADSQMDFDIELAKRQSNENPVYYVQYAHARTAGIFAQAAERGISGHEDGDVGLLVQPSELALIRKMLQLPEMVDLIAATYEPHHLPHYAYDLARAFTAFYDECKVLSEDVPLTTSRLKLVAAAQVALARVLTLMGMSAPERM
ncbi:MAG: arginine--tRNA ligase [Dehalococcoidia bacterium]